MGRGGKTHLPSLIEIWKIVNKSYNHYASSLTSTPPSAPLTTKGRTTRSQLTLHEPHSARSSSIDDRISASRVESRPSRS